MTDPSSAEPITVVSDTVEVTTDLALVEDVTDVSTLLPLPARKVVYLVLIMASAFWGIATESVDLEWYWTAAWSAFTIGAGALALGNARPAR